MHMYTKDIRVNSIILNFGFKGERSKDKNINNDDNGW